MVPRGAWEAIQDVSSLERAIEDLEFRVNELRAENRVSLKTLCEPLYVGTLQRARP